MPYKSWGCSKCGQQAPLKLRAHGQFAERMKWLRRHMKAKHPVLFKRMIKKGVQTKKRKG